MPPMMWKFTAGSHTLRLVCGEGRRTCGGGQHGTPVTGIYGWPQPHAIAPSVGAAGAHKERLSSEWLEGTFTPRRKSRTASATMGPRTPAECEENILAEREGFEPSMGDKPILP